MKTIPSNWLLLVVSLPTDSATARMRIWRALKSLGCGALRDGAYLLPDRTAQQRQLSELAAETLREGGSAWLLTVQAQSTADNEAYCSLFDRSAEMTQFVEGLTRVRRTLDGLTAADINRALRKLRREYDALCSTDYFPSQASAAAQAAWMDFIHVAEALLSPGEPQATNAPIVLLDVAAFQGRLWATRRHLWVDRVASAWLIQRFIDQQARFAWVDTPAECPPEALGFDFDQARFTHVGERVTFEVLVVSFGLGQDTGLLRLGAMVHTLDVGGTFVPEASGFEAMLSGARQRARDDDQLLQEISLVLDSLYQHFSSESKVAPSPA